MIPRRTSDAPGPAGPQPAEDERVRQVAARSRRAFMDGLLTHVTFERFPLGACGDCSELLREYLSECGLGEWDYRWGWRDGRSHGWLEQSGLVVDITADQFGDGQPGVVVTRERGWHDQFEMSGAPRRAGLHYYDGGSAGQPLQLDYALLKARADLAQEAE